MISEEEYKTRRAILGDTLDKNSLAVLFSANHKTRSNDTSYPYRQDSNFYYLSGFKEDNSCLLLIKDKKNIRTVLFVQKKDKEKELWNGKRVGVKKAKKRFLVDAVHEYTEFENIFKKEITTASTLYFDFNLDYSKVKVLKRYAKNLNTHKNLSIPIQKMRLIKSDTEILLIKKAIEITKKAHHTLMKLDKLNKNEFELQAQLEYDFKRNGAYSDAYTSIVASGNNANTLHYIKNDKPLKNGTLILIDAGCEYEYYASDITRTIPVNGTFTKAQKELYNLVLNTQAEVIKMIKPNIKRSQLQKKAIKCLTEGMVNLGILKGDVKKLIKKQKYKKYYPHGIGHWMGLDVHDECPYIDEKGKEIKLMKGMVLTIEPAIYIDKNDKQVPKKYRGIGIRIEDDILVSLDGYENLSKSILKY
ncbi:MAG: M24 family metallopeptidase [Epsilonproteobacteria bacterium]|nr:M24 family metallopeptidase [Campylobacterota bacterium]